MLIETTNGGKEVGGVDLLITLQKARIAPRTGVALRFNRYLDRTAVLL